MTREEHIENLKAIASDMPSDKCSDWIESLMAGVKALEQVSSSEKPNKWIPVETALPDKNMRCLVVVGRFNYTQIATYSDLMGTIDHRIFFRGDNEHGNFEDITQYVKAWMPLPQPYQPEIPTRAEGSDKE